MANDNGRTGPESASVGGTEVTAVTSDSMTDILGWTVVYTIGPRFTVDRTWLEEAAGRVGLDVSLLPTETTDRRAWSRACKRADRTDLNDARHPQVDVETNRDEDDSSVFNLEVVDRRPDDDIVHEEVAQFEYDSGSLFTTVTTATPEYVELASEYTSHTQELFELHKQSNTGADLRRAIREFVKATDTAGVKMRDAGAVYFVPRQAGDDLLAFKELMEEVDETWKTSGFECAVDTIEVIDSADKRDMVERKVRRTLDTVVESALESAFEELDEETAAQDVVSEVGSDLVRAENVAVEHNALLDVELSVEETIESWKDRVVDEQKEALVEAAAKEVDV